MLACAICNHDSVAEPWWAAADALHFAAYPLLPRLGADGNSCGHPGGQPLLVFHALLLDAGRDPFMHGFVLSVCTLQACWFTSDPFGLCPPYVFLRGVGTLGVDTCASD